jgi:hypothetical protein
MGTLLASDVIDRVGTALYDTNNAKWSVPELLGYLNDGQRVIAGMQPTDIQTIQIAPLIPGARQVLPLGAWMLNDVLRNMGTNGLTPGRAIRIISRRLLDAFNPLWMTGPQSAVVQSYIFDLRDQISFFVYPPSTGGVYVEVNYSGTPTPLTAETQPINILDIMEEALFNYMMYRACGKLADYSPGPQVAAAFWSIFNEVLGVRANAEDIAIPNAELERSVPPPSDIKGES